MFIGYGDEENDAIIGDEEADESEEFEDLEDDIDDSQDDDHGYRTQAEFDVAFERRLARERRNLAKKMGFNSIEEAADFANAGRAVTGASGLTPAEVRSKLAQQAAQQAAEQGGQVPAQYGGIDVQKELQELKSMIQDDHVEKTRAKQIEAARKEFGKLFDQHLEDIEDKAEETGLSMIDAAAIVLRPKMKEHIEETANKKKQFQKKRKVEGTDGKTVSSINYETALTEAEKKIAQRMGRTYEQYYARKKQLGEIE
jgi:hypothetical protein